MSTYVVDRDDNKIMAHSFKNIRLFKEILLVSELMSKQIIFPLTVYLYFFSFSYLFHAS